MTSIREIARRAGTNSAAASRAVKGRFPVRDPEAAQRLKNALEGVCGAQGYNAPPAPREGRHGDLYAVQMEKNLAPRRENAEEPSPEAQPITEMTEEKQMLIQKPRVAPSVQKAFNLPPDVFSPPTCREEVFLGPELRVVYEHMLAKARYGGLLAVVGESGAGKSTVKDLLVTDLAAEGEIITIEPYTQQMEENENAGKPLKSANIIQALMHEIAPTAKLWGGTETQLRQVAACLAESLSASRNRRHLLIIEEAHRLPKTTLRHLKRFLEMKNPAVKGLQRPMLSILLIGQPELADRLSPRDPTVREVWQRCEVVRLPALGKSLHAYVAHRLGAAARVFEPEAVDTLARLLTARDGCSYVYPQAVDNWLAIILEASVGIGNTITAAHVEEAHAQAIKALREGRK